jgi:hypothetical protein
MNIKIRRYLLIHPAQHAGLYMSGELRDKFLRNGASYGLDLAALILQMGRDHGLPGYTAFREWCGGTPTVKFNHYVRRRFSCLYRADTHIQRLGTNCE